MAYAVPRPDGLHDVTLDDGRTLPMALDAGQLQSIGATFGTPPGATALRATMQPTGEATDAPQAPYTLAPQAQGGLSGEQLAGNVQAASGAPQTVRAQVPLAQPRAPEQPARTPGAKDPAQEALVQQVIADELRGGGGSQRDRTYLAGSKVKRTVAGPVDPKLAEGIDTEQQLQDLRQEQIAERQYNAKETELGSRERDIALEQAQIDRDLAKRRSIDQRLSALGEQRDKRVETVASWRQPEIRDFWREQGTFGKFAAAIAMAFGGALQGLRGGENPGLQMTNNVIDRWVADQRAKYDQAKDAADAGKTAYGEALQEYGSPQQAEADMRLRAMAARERQMQLEADRLQNPAAFEAAKAMIEQSKLDRKRLQAQAQAAASTEVEEEYKTQLGGTGGGSRLGKALAAGAEAKKNLDVINGTEEAGKAVGRSVQYAGQTLYFPREGDAKEAAGTLNSIDTLRKNFRRLDELSKTTRLGDKHVRGEIDAISAENQFAMRELYGLNRLNDQELTTFKELSGERLNSLWSSDERTRGALKQAQQMLGRKTQQILQQGSAAPNAQVPVTRGTPSTFQPE